MGLVVARSQFRAVRRPLYVGRAMDRIPTLFIFITACLGNRQALNFNHHMKKAIILAILMLTVIGLPSLAQITHVTPTVSLVSVEGSRITVKFQVLAFTGETNRKVNASIAEGPNDNVKCYITSPDGTQSPIVSVTKTLDDYLVFDAGIIIEEGKYALSCDANLVKLKWTAMNAYYESYSVVAYNYAFTLKDIELKSSEIGIDPSLDSNYIQNEQYIDVSLSLKQSGTSNWTKIPVKSILNASGVSLLDPEGNPVEIEDVSVGYALETSTLRFKVKNGIVDGNYTLSVSKNSISITDKAIGNPAFRMVLELQATSQQEPQPTILRVSSPDSHAYEVSCPEGHSAKVTFHPAQGWVVATVFYNDLDVTSSCVDNSYVTPPMTGTNHLQLIMKDDSSTGAETTNFSIPSLNVINRTLNIKGIPDDLEIEIYDMNGSCLYKGYARSLPVSEGNTYLVNISGTIYKFMVE